MTITAYETARINMVKSQLKPNDVHDERVLEAFKAIPREEYMPAALKNAAYVDEDILIGAGRYMMEPMVLARLIQAAEVKPQSYCLVIGAATGYSLAVLSMLSDTIVGLEEDESLFKQCADILSDSDLSNIAIFNKPLIEGYKEQAPYDVILIEGAVAAIPESLIMQLRENGRMVVIEKTAQEKTGKGVLYKKRNGILSRQTLFDAHTPYLNGFDPKPEFAL